MIQTNTLSTEKLNKIFLQFGKKGVLKKKQKDNSCIAREKRCSDQETN